MTSSRQEVLPCAHPLFALGNGVHGDGLPRQVPSEDLGAAGRVQTWIKHTGMKHSFARFGAPLSPDACTIHPTGDITVMTARQTC